MTCLPYNPGFIELFTGVSVITVKEQNRGRLSEQAATLLHRFMHRCLRSFTSFTKAVRLTLGILCARVSVRVSLAVCIFVYVCISVLLVR